MPHFTKPNKYSTGYNIKQKDYLNDRTSHIVLKKNENLFIFLLSFLLNIGVAYIFYFVLRIGNSDALSRTANAYYVLYSRDPHLAAIGFIWPQLPSILQLPLLPVTKSIRNYSFYRQHYFCIIRCGMFSNAEQTADEYEFHDLNPLGFSRIITISSLHMVFIFGRNVGSYLLVFYSDYVVRIVNLS